MILPKTPAVYLIRCANSENVYVGSSSNPRTRWRTHIYRLRLGTHHSVHLQNAFAKHGEASFAMEVVEPVDDVVFLRAREQFWIWRLADRLYNRSMDAFGVEIGNTIRLGQKMPADYVEALAERMLGNSYRLGVPHTDADKLKIGVGVTLAYAEGRHVTADPAISAANLRKFNEDVQAGRRVVIGWKSNVTHCPSGHPYAGENLGIARDGSRFCRTCGRTASLRCYYSKKAKEIAVCH